MSWLILMFAVLVSTERPTLNIIQKQGNYSEQVTYYFNRTTEYVLVYPISSSMYPYRIKAWTRTAKPDIPVLVVVRQEREVLSWQVPFVVATHYGFVDFYNTSRTLCHNNMTGITNPKKSGRFEQFSQSFIVALSTSSLNKVDLTVIVEEERDFYIKEDNQYSISVSPSETKYYYYKFSSDLKASTSVIQITSEDDICLTVSIQDSFCPVFDLDKDITYEGKYQTINRKGGMSIRRKDYPNGFFLVFVAKSDNYDCSQKHSSLPREQIATEIKQINRTSIVNFIVRKGISGLDYGIASLITLGTIFGVYLIVITMILVFTKWGTISSFIKNQNNTSTKKKMVEAEPIITAKDRQILIAQKSLTVDLLAKAPAKDQRRAYNYLWHILSIAIFYSIPVVQLVITYQRVVNRTGDQDMCYYNFLCANPAFGLSDYNHIFSNIGYVFMGLLFLAAVLYRHFKIRDSTTGIPVHYGVFYAMGIALIIEGLLSACYHICPSQSNYQFDTSFMYVMAVLCMIKLYQNRHPDVNATAYATFSVLGLTIFLAMLGILNGSLTVWIIFVVIYSLLCAYISFKIYFISFVFDGFKQLKDNFRSSTNTVNVIVPLKKGRFILLLIANFLNYGMLITGLCLYNSGVTDFGTFLLGILMGNAILYAIFYTLMKIINGERICFEAIIYGVLSIAAWISASIFFFDNATLWTVTAAESRQWNQDCILMDFFDKHDVWHLLSAPALFLTFMFLMCLDDDIVDKNREEIIVF